MDTTFKGAHGTRSGYHIAILAGAPADSGFLTNGTTIVPIPTPYRKLYVLRLSAHRQAAGSGVTCTATIMKRYAVGGASVGLSDTLTLFSGSFLTDQKSHPFTGLEGNPTTPKVSDADRFVNEGDMLYVSVVTNTLTSQAVGLYFLAEVAVIE